MKINTTTFDKIALGKDHYIYVTKAEHRLSFSTKDFEQFWNMHPKEYHDIKIHGKWLKTPRWQQAYGMDYRYTGSKNNALPISKELKEIQEWCWDQIDPKFNALLLNWYDGTKGHYIGAHRDDTRDLQQGHPIVTLSLGEERVFRMRPWKGQGYKDLTMRNGDAIIIPWDTNLIWTHEVPKFKRYQGKRISITLRVFETE